MKKRILIVDDEKNIRLTISKSLSSDSIQIEQAISAEEALALMELTSYDLMLLDLRLPGMSGMELMDRLRKANNNIKIVIISAHGTIETAVKLLKAGALDFIEKPFSPDEIRQIVAKYI